MLVIVFFILFLSIIQMISFLIYKSSIEKSMRSMEEEILKIKTKIQE